VLLGLPGTAQTARGGESRRCAAATRPDASAAV